MHSFIAGVVDSGDKPFHSNIFANFRKNRVLIAMGETDLWKKQKLNILNKIPFKSVRFALE